MNFIINFYKKELIFIFFSHEAYHDTPDALFPNNWFSTHKINSKSTMCLYPMKALNRRKEKRKDIINYLQNLYPNMINLSIFEENDPPKALESTGSLVLDRIKKIAFMVQSERSHIETATEWSKIFSYELITFDAVDESGKPIYHTNVVLSIGTGWIVVCLEVISDEKQRNLVQSSLESLGKEIIYISQEQQKNYCANILELMKLNNEKIIALSKTAFKSFTESQIERLQNYAKLIPINIENIEKIGGGSVRCMIAELF